MKVFIPLLASHSGVGNRDLLEKDVRLHLLLAAVAEEPEVGGNLIFKGGSCLIKCYLNYPRFSTDLDFTWQPQGGWGSLGTRELRRELRPLQRNLEEVLRNHAGNQGLVMEKDGGVRYGQSNRMMTVTLSYVSLHQIPSTIKFQVNFAEPLSYPTKRRVARGLLGPVLPDEIAFLDSDLPRRYAKPVRLPCYDAREILAEKGRAVLTRQAAKGRDLLDLFLMEEELGLRIEEHVDVILAKTRSALDRASRYREHLRLADSRFGRLMDEDVAALLIRRVPMRGFEEYRRRALEVLRGVSQGLR